MSDITTILDRLNNGETTIDELKELVKLSFNNYKKSGKQILTYIEYEGYNELLRRLKSSVFSAAGNSYPEDFKRYCIYGEYQNTKLFIDLAKKIISMGGKYGSVTNPALYGQPNPGFTIPEETVVHILLRHNEMVNGLINPDSVTSGHNPSSFGFGALAEPMLTMFMALNVLEERDWKSASTGKNLICHFKVGGNCYTVIRKGSSKEILSFYPRNDDLQVNFIKLKRIPDKMAFERE